MNIILDHRIEQNQVECIEVNQETDTKNIHAYELKGPTRAARSFKKNGDLNFSFQSQNNFQI